MGTLIGLAVLFFVGALAGPVLAIVALVRCSRLDQEIARLERQIELLRRRLAGGAEAASEAAATAAAARPPTRPAAAVPAAAPAAPVMPVVSPHVPPIEAAPSVPVAVPPAIPAAATPPPSAAPARAVPAGPSRPQPPARDFATNLGPRILIATGALAFTVFLGLFVKYAWDNNWVGPAGRVLLGGVMGVALIAVGVKLLGREYRPLGQGLAGAGLASLYVSAFGAHGFYDLIPREWAGVLMAVITANAVLLAARLDTRLLAALAWLGGFLTPVLLSTGEDKAIALYLFLLLLDAGALVLDHRKPWPETLPLAMFGTLSLYAGWYAQFFRPERFGVAAAGLVLFTALFIFGMARKERGIGALAVVLLGTLGLACLAFGANRPEWLLLLSLLLAGFALWLAEPLGKALAPAAALAFLLPLLAWRVEHYRPEGFGLAAAWLCGGLALFALVGAAGTQALLRGAVFVFTGVLSISIAAETDLPAGLGALLLAQAGIAILARREWRWAELAGAATAFGSVLAWLDAFFRSGRAADAYVIALPAAAAYLASLVGRGLVRRVRLEASDLLTHVVGATLTWTVFYRVLYASNPRALGLISLGLAALYLGFGLLALRRHVAGTLHARTLLGLAAAFLTIAIPVQLGLHGITLAWAAEGALLVALGLRFGSGWTRLAGYGVLGLAALRLFVRHFPLHDSQPFTAVVNPAFGTWLFVVGALSVAVLVARKAAGAGSPDPGAVPLLSIAALGLLFLLLSTETWDALSRSAQAAMQAGDFAAAHSARVRAGLALSVLWTAFATAMLAGGLALRNRPLYFSAYGLLAVTAFKVVLVDLARFQTLYRMLSFLALAVLLMAGAWLALRFRERLLPREVER